MLRNLTRMSVAVAAAAALGALGMTGASASGTPAGAPLPVRVPAVGTDHPPASPGDQFWLQRYSAGNGFDVAIELAVSPDGGTVFVTGRSVGAGSAYDYATVAYNAATGAKIWVQRYNGPANSGDTVTSMAVSPDGGTVFVTGESVGATSLDDYATVAYNAATGAELWVQRYSTGARSGAGASSVAVSPDASTVFVTGYSPGATSSDDYTTIAYNTATGAKLWVKRYNGPANAFDGAASVAVSPDGGTVFVTGQSVGSNPAGDYATIAYNAATGAKLWVQRYNTAGGGEAGASSVAVSPDAGTVFVTGSSAGAISSDDYATIAYNAATGAKLWVKRYNGPANGRDRAASLTVSPDGGTVFVTGQSVGSNSAGDYATIAYDAATGAKLWVQRYNGPRHGAAAASVAVSPDGKTVFVTGQSTGAGTGVDYATLAYDAATGAKLWMQRYNGPGNSGDWATWVAVSPSGGTVFVTGGSWGSGTGVDYATIAYNR